jgi:hypothetical protein
MSDTTTTTDKPKITITLSDRPPVRVVKSEWPIIARADWYSGQHECQANEIAWIRVRQSRDSGRVIVYGMRERGPGGMAIGYRETAAGYLLTLADDRSNDAIVRAIRRVAGAIDMPMLGDECIGDLPAEDLE